MKFLFIDETEKFGYFGIAAVFIDAMKYEPIVLETSKILSETGWNLSEEFKAKNIFSSTSGDLNIDVSSRMVVAEKFIKTNVAATNVNFSSFFYYIKGVKNIENYQLLLEKIFKRLPQKRKGRPGKKLISVCYDQITMKGIKNVFENLRKILEDKGYVLVENCFSVDSSNYTPGILLADHIAFISMWDSLNTEEREEEQDKIKLKKNEYIRNLVNELGKIEKKEV